MEFRSGRKVTSHALQSYISAWRRVERWLSNDIAVDHQNVLEASYGDGCVIVRACASDVRSWKEKMTVRS